MILVHYAEGRYTPVLACDICEKRITDGQLGAVVFKHPNPGESELLPVMHVHKGNCHKAAEERLGGDLRCGWLELQTHLLYLVLNSKLTLEGLVEERDARDAAGEWAN
jgi:hypothetical protein